mmetsp:Transcript_60062/g.135820  ORF Transcript_60062/g.135820 Transcript_60062/m.135820 type:complete len:284 (-) Transcript_60062:212-1063(-)
MNISRVWLRLALAIFVFLLASSQPSTGEDDWETWLETSAMTTRQYESLLTDTATSLKMEPQQLMESLLDSRRRDASLPDPVTLLLQLREELQLETDLSEHGADQAVDSGRETAKAEPSGVDPSPHKAANGGASSRKRAPAGAMEDGGEARSGKQAASPASPRQKSPSILDEVKAQVMADLDKVRGAIEVVVPEPARLVIAQVAAAIVPVINSAKKVVVYTVLPGLRTWVLNEGSPGRRLGARIASGAVGGAKRLRDKVAAMMKKGGDQDEEEGEDGLDGQEEQ